MKKKGCIITGISLIVFLAIIVVYIVGIYNSLVEKDQFVKQKWSQVENQYQRRSDLIPNLVNTVKGYAKHEKETLTEVVEARSKATSVNIDPTKLTPDALNQFKAAQQGLSQALSKLMVVVERYPDLKANENFMQLQAQLEGTENRIAVERKRYNEAVQEYNTYIKKFPAVIFARMLGFNEYPYFKAEKGAEKAPEVKF